MDAIRFDQLTRALTDSTSRRTVTGIGLAGLLGSLTGLTNTEARRKKNRRKKKCKGGKKKCGKKCIPKSNCCRDADCSAGGSCEGGDCTCPTGLKACQGACIPDGDCCSDADCLGGAICQGGVCACRAGDVLCGEVCADLLSNAAHCGSCDTPCPSGSTCVHGTCTCDPFANACPNEVDGQCSCGAIVADEFTAACVSRNSACDLEKPCETNDDCPPRSVCLLGCADPPAPNPRRCSNPCNPV
jgi:hypothetical protein